MTTSPEQSADAGNPGEFLQLTGVSVHNLQNVDVAIPVGQLTVIAGVSGSGKSSLAFDTLFAESRRRFLEAYSPQLRRRLDRFARPTAAHIGPLPPAVALQQQSTTRRKDATIAEVSEIADYLQIVFATVGIPHCPQCGREVTQDTAETVLQALNTYPDGTRFQICTPLPDAYRDDDRIHWKQLPADGFTRAIVDGQTHTLPAKSLPDSSPDPDRILLLLDRLATGAATALRTRDSLELAFRAGDGHCVLLVTADAMPNESNASVESLIVDDRSWRVLRFNSQEKCADCGTACPPPEPRLFNRRSRIGACPQCHGRGSIDDNSLVTGDKPVQCTACNGQRLSPEALAVALHEQTFADWLHLSPNAWQQPWEHWQRRLDERQQSVLATPLEAIATRLSALRTAGCGDLPLDRFLPTLSSGEAQRVALAAIVGTTLVNTLYVLDEPTAGLSPSEVATVLHSLEAIRDAGNTVVVVEHQAEIVAAADYLIEVGPGAGTEGGHVIFQGAPNKITDNTLTTPSQVSELDAFPTTERAPTGELTLHVEKFRCLQNSRYKFPLGVLSVVTGRSGVGKTTLVCDALPLAIEAAHENRADSVRDRLHIDGAERLQGVVVAERSPPGRSARSNPATYLQVFDEIRKVFASTADARKLGLTATHFSFNSKAGGRCVRCLGSGLVSVELQFLPDVEVVCPSCEGTRYEPRILGVRYRDRTIADVLNMTAREAFPFFRNQRKIQQKLTVLTDVGLDYLCLGQPLSTLSGGEGQRLRLAEALSGTHRSRTLFLLDQPATGLHDRDVLQLLKCWLQLLDVGHTVIVIDHHPLILHYANHVLEMT